MGMNNKKIEIRVSPIVACIFMIAIGVILVILSYYKFSAPLNWWITWGKPTSNSIGTTLIASSVVSIILEFSNMRKLYQDSLKDILNADFPLEAYSKEYLEKFQLKLVLAICNKENVGITEEYLNGSIYNAYESQLRDSTIDIYYEYLNSNYHIIPNEKEGIFNIRAEVTYKIVNKYGKDASVRFRAKTYSLDERSTKNDFAMKLFQINDRKIDPRAYIKKEPIPQKEYLNYYNYKITVEKPLKDGKKNVVKMQYEYNVPIFDCLQSYKVTFPCKRININFRIHEDRQTKAKWRLQAVAFAAYYNKQREADSKFKVEQNEDDSVKINFDEWVFPGSGYVVTFIKS